MNVDIIIPCFNEEKNIEKLVQLWSEVTKRNENFYIYFVENGSGDDTRENLKKYIKLYHPKRTNVLLIDKNIGYGHGIKFGIQNSKNEIICWTHADLQIPVEDVVSIINKFLSLNNENVLIKGKRSSRKFIDSFFTTMMSIIGFLFTGYFISDINAQPKVLSRKLFDKVKNFPNNFLLDAHLLYSSKLKRIEIISFESQFLTRVNNKPKGGGSILGKIKLSALTMKYLFTFRKNKKIY